MTLREATIKQFEYCKAIAEDIIANGKSLDIIKYTKQFAQIESPMTGETQANWIRIQFSNIYIFLHDDGRIDYQLDFEHAYGGELIDVDSEEKFFEIFNKYSEEELVEIFNKTSEFDEWDIPSEYVRMK